MSREAAYLYLNSLRGMVEAMRLLGGSDSATITLAADDGWRLSGAFAIYIDHPQGESVSTIEGDMAWVEAFGVRIQWPKDYAKND